MNFLDLGRKAALAVGIALALPSLTGAPAFSQERSQGIAMELAVHPAPLMFEANGTEHSFELEIADTAERRARGLMFRTDLPEDRGMLFVFESTRQVGFWMKNTPLPLDLVFIDENGVVVDILPGEPFSTASIAPEAASRFVLELHRGTAEETGLEAGVELQHPAIQAVADQQ